MSTYSKKDGGITLTLINTNSFWKMFNKVNENYVHSSITYTFQVFSNSYY